MRVLMRQLGIAVVLTLWIVSGPIAMAFNGCLLMGGMCEVPCGMLSYIGGTTSSGVVALTPVAYLTSRPGPQFGLISARPPTPPPKSALLSV